MATLLRRGQFIPAICFLLIIGCSTTDAVPDLLQISTDRTVYDLSEHELVQYQVDNQTDMTLFYSGCTDLSVERLQGTTAVDTLGVARCECICLTELKPGERVDLSLPLNLATDGIWFEHGERYRIGVALFEDAAMTHPIANLPYVYSNSFGINE